MSRNFSFLTIRHNTTILVDRNLYVVQGNLNHLDESTTGIDSTLNTEQSRPNELSRLGKPVLGFPGFWSW